LIAWRGVDGVSGWPVRHRRDRRADRPRHSKALFSPCCTNYNVCAPDGTAFQPRRRLTSTVSSLNASFRPAVDPSVLPPQRGRTGLQNRPDLTTGITPDGHGQVAYRPILAGWLWLHCWCQFLQPPRLSAPQPSLGGNSVRPSEPTCFPQS